MRETAPLGGPEIPEYIGEAVRMFRDYQFSRYGLLLGVACVVNAIGAALLRWFSPAWNPTLLFLTFIAVVGPLWLCYMYFVRPRLMVALLAHSSPASMSASMDATHIVVDVDGRERKVAWKLAKDVLEGTGVFVVVLSPLTFLMLPRPGLTEPLAAALRGKVKQRAA